MKIAPDLTVMRGLREAQFSPCFISLIPLSVAHEQQTDL